MISSHLYIEQVFSYLANSLNENDKMQLQKQKRYSWDHSRVSK